MSPPVLASIKWARFMPRTTTGFIALGALLFVVWACLFPLDVFVRGKGVMRVEMHNITIQAQEGGVIRRMAVKEGDLVKAGDLLAEVENTFVDEAFAKSSASRGALLAKQYRLQREIAGQPMEQEAVTSLDSVSAEAFRSELDAYRLRQSVLSESESVLKAQVAQRNAEAAALRGQITDLSKELSLQQEQVRMIEPMVKKGAAAEGVLLQKRSDLQRVQSSLNQARLKLPQVEAESQEAESRLRQVRADFLSSAQQELTETETLLSRTDAEANANTGRKSAARIVAPTDGEIHRVLALHEGTVVKAGGDLIELAPTNVPLIAEVRVRPEDRGHIWSGMSAKVRVSALSGATGALTGKVTVISPDTVTDQNGERFYAVTLSVDDSQEVARIRPGMGVDTYLEAGRRTVMSYLVKPIIQAGETALSEPGQL